MWNFIVFFCHQQLWRNNDKNISVKILFCCWGIYFSYEPSSVAWWSRAPSIQSNMSYVCGQKCLQIMIWAQSMQLDLLFPFQAKGLIHMHDVFHEVRSVWVHRQSSIFEMISGMRWIDSLFDWSRFVWCAIPLFLSTAMPKKTCIAVHCTAIHWQLAHSQGQLISILVSRVITSWCHQCSSGCLITPLPLIWAFKWFEVRRD